MSTQPVPIASSSPAQPKASPAEPAGPTSDQVAEGVSAFLSRVLHQLSITAWLPAVFFIGNAAVLLNLQGQAQLDVAKAVSNMAGLEWGALVILLFAVIITAMVIQAFEFEGLRFWEGYLRSARLSRWATRRIAAQQVRRARLEEEEQLRMEAAFDDARRRALDDLKTGPHKRALFDAMEKVIHERQLDQGEGSLADEAFLDLKWIEYADPGIMHQWDVSRLKLAEYPSPHRLLPTRLGNVMRAAEDQIVLEDGEDLEGFMIRHLDELPKTIVSEHDDYRRRLEMYCGLMFAIAALAIFSVISLWGSRNDLPWRIAIPSAYASAVWVCYRAAIASALGFGQSIKEASAWLQRP